MRDGEEEEQLDWDTGDLQSGIQDRGDGLSSGVGMSMLTPGEPPVPVPSSSRSLVQQTSTYLSNRGGVTDSAGQSRGGSSGKGKKKQKDQVDSRWANGSPSGSGSSREGGSQANQASTLIRIPPRQVSSLNDISRASGPLLTPSSGSSASAAVQPRSAQSSGAAISPKQSPKKRAPVVQPPVFPSSSALLQARNFSTETAAETRARQDRNTLELESKQTKVELTTKRLDNNLGVLRRDFGALQASVDAQANSAQAHDVLTEILSEVTASNKATQTQLASVQQQTLETQNRMIDLMSQIHSSRPTPALDGDSLASQGTPPLPAQTSESNTSSTSDSDDINIDDHSQHRSFSERLSDSPRASLASRIHGHLAPRIEGSFASRIENPLPVINPLPLTGQKRKSAKTGFPKPKRLKPENDSRGHVTLLSENKSFRFQWSNETFWNQLNTWLSRIPGSASSIIPEPHSSATKRGHRSRLLSFSSHEDARQFAEVWNRNRTSLQDASHIYARADGGAD